MPVVKGPTESSAVRFYPHERIAAAPVAKRNATSKDGMRRKRAARPEDLHSKANASLSDGMAFTFFELPGSNLLAFVFPISFSRPGSSESGSKQIWLRMTACVSVTVTSNRRRAESHLSQPAKPAWPFTSHIFPFRNLLPPPTAYPPSNSYSSLLPFLSSPPTRLSLVCGLVAHWSNLFFLRRFLWTPLRVPYQWRLVAPDRHSTWQRLRRPLMLF